MRGILRAVGHGDVPELHRHGVVDGADPDPHGFGSAAVAGNTIGIRIILFALLPSFGVSNAAATLVGQNLGAGKPDRAEAAAWRAGLYNTICLGVVGLIFLLFAPPLIGIFTSDPEVAALRHPLPAHRRRRLPVLRLRHGADAGVQRRRRHADADAASTCSACGAGRSRSPGCWRYPLGFGPTGVFIAVSVAFSTLAVVSAWLFRRETGSCSACSWQRVGLTSG